MKTQHSPRVTLTPLAQKMDVMDDECLVTMIALTRPPVPRQPQTGVQCPIQRRSTPNTVKGRDYLVQVQKVNTKYNCYVQKRNYRDKRLINNLQLPFSVPGDFHNIKSDIPHIIAQPKALNYIFENADNLQEKQHLHQSKLLEDSSLNIISTNEQTPDNQPKEHNDTVTMTTQLLPGDPVLYYNKQTQQLISGIYSTVFTQKFGPPVYRDALLQNNFRCCSLTPIIYNHHSKNYFVNVALKFTQVSNYVKINNNTDIDLLILTNEIIGDWRTHITEEQQKKLQNTILISLMALKQ